MIYLDHHAATPLSAAVREAMARVHEQAWANPASVHGAGRLARGELERARRTIAEAVGAEASEIVFASGGTESCNLAVHGLASKARHLITSELEHPAVLAAVRAQKAEGAEVRELPLAGGPPAPAELARAIRPETGLVALQWVNHETGVISPVEEYAAICRARGVPLLIDASQALGKLPCDVRSLGASAVVFTSSKIGGPTGAAALYVARGRELAPLVHGGGQERGRRAGTPEVAATAGFAAAIDGLPGRLAAMPRVAGLRDRLEATCVARGAVSNGKEAPRVATVCNVSVPGWRGEVLVAALDVEGLCVSSGAACSSGLGEPSPVLRALYPSDPTRAESALRISLGPETSEDEVSRAIAVLERVLARR